MKNEDSSNATAFTIILVDMLRESEMCTTWMIYNNRCRRLIQRSTNKNKKNIETTFNMSEKQSEYRKG